MGYGLCTGTSLNNIGSMDKIKMRNIPQSALARSLLVCTMESCRIFRLYVQLISWNILTHVTEKSTMKNLCMNCGVSHSNSYSIPVQYTYILFRSKKWCRIDACNLIPHQSLPHCAVECNVQML